MFDKKITIKYFFESITTWQKYYWHLEDSLKKEGITDSEVEAIYHNQKAIAQDVARFILNRNMSVEILNNELIENGMVKV